MRISSLSIIVALAAWGCNNTGTDVDAGFDAGGDAGPPGSACPTTNVPAPDELMGPCCWRTSNADRQDVPEMRLTYFDITAPAGSPVASTTLRSVLNRAMQQETFVWLFRAEGASVDGPVTVTTGFGRRQTDGTYAFSTGAAEGDPAGWCPAELSASLAIEVLNSDPFAGAVTVPIFDETGMTLQAELTLRSVAIVDATWSEERSCMGVKTSRPFTYDTAATLTGFIEVDTARGQNIDVPGVSTSLCAAVAGSLSDPAYCDTAQGTWATPPDSLCDASACARNTTGMTDVCDPAADCNAWQLVASFAASGVDITNGLCP